MVKSPNEIETYVAKPVAFEKLGKNSELSVLGSMMKYGQIDARHVPYLNNYPSIWKKRVFTSAMDFYHWITTDQGMADSAFKQAFGDNFVGQTGDTSKAEGVNPNILSYLGMRIFFPESMRAARRKTFVTILKHVKQEYIKHGLGDVIAGDVRFSNINGAAGLYYPATHDIRIDPASKRLDTLPGTLIHEFAHRYYYQVKPLIQGKVREKYLEGVRAGGAIKNQNNYAFRQGDKFTYTGTDPKYLKYGKSWRLVVGRGTMKLYAADTNIGLTAKSVDTYLSLGFAPEKDIDLKRIPFSASEIYANHSTFTSSEWFPTEYSKTNQSEWFAELFSLFIQNRLTGEPKTFIEGLLKV